MPEACVLGRPVLAALAGTRRGRPVDGKAAPAVPACPIEFLEAPYDGVARRPLRRGVFAMLRIVP